MFHQNYKPNMVMKSTEPQKYITEKRGQVTEQIIFRVSCLPATLEDLDGIVSAEFGHRRANCLVRIKRDELEIGLPKDNEMVDDWSVTFVPPNLYHFYGREGPLSFARLMPYALRITDTERPSGLSLEGFADGPSLLICKL